MTEIISCWQLFISLQISSGLIPPPILNVCFCSAVPSSVENINYKNISSSSVLLYWDIPLNPNGKIIHYTVYAMELDTNKAFQMTTSNNSILISGRSHIFKNCNSNTENLFELNRNIVASIFLYLCCLHALRNEFFKAVALVLFIV